MRLLSQHLFFRAPAALAFLSADFLDPFAFGRNETLLLSLDFVQKEPAREKPVKRLLPCRLAFDLQARRAMEQHHAGCGFVDVLTAVAARANEGLLDVRLVDAERDHPGRELRLLILSDRLHHETLAARGGM